MGVVGRSAGFTILEVMMAIFIFALVLTAIYTTWLSILRGTKVSLDAAAAVQRSRIAMHALEAGLDVYAEKPLTLTIAEAKLAIQAVDLLQNGDEPAAHAVLDRALAADATNDLAKKLLDQIRADPQKELGGVYFRYTVQRDDSLSKLAQQYLGDRFRFYILARYNEMPNPSWLAAGQVIKIPGKGPLPAAAPKPPEVGDPAAWAKRMASSVAAKSPTAM